MAPVDIKKASRKRKIASEAVPEPPEIINIPDGAIELGNDEEPEYLTDDDAPGSEGVDEFPEIVEESDSEEESEDEDLDGAEDLSSEEESASLESDTDTKPGIYPKPLLITSNITGKPKKVYPEIEAEYDSDSSTEEDPNRIGNVPMHWYDDMPHIGYSMDGSKVYRPARGDELDRFLATEEDPSSWMSAFDKKMQNNQELTSEELDIIRRLQKGENPDGAYDPYEPTIEWFTGPGKEEPMPLSAAPEPKRRFVPSKWEKQKIMKIVRAIRQGRIVPSKPKTADSKPQFYAIWSSDPSSSSAPPPPPAPKPRLPTNAESYNPPEEYLPTTEEKADWENTDKEDRERDFLPQKFSSFRLVPAYDQFIQERFGRQLDLYLAPRVTRTKLRIDPESLIPKLPSPNSLKPFPNYRALRFEHNIASRVRAVSVSPDGAWVVTGDESGVVSLWEVMVGREVKRWTLGGKVGTLEWCPRTDVSFFVAGIEEELHFFVPPNLPATIWSDTRSLLAPATLPAPPDAASSIKWTSTSANTHSEDKAILCIRLPASSGLIGQIAWHRRGDYVATVSSNELHGGVWIHQLSRRHSQAPFKKIRGTVQSVLFHPLKPHFFVATQRYVRIYNLSEQKLLKTLMPGIRWISSMDVHPSGDHLIVGGYDRKLCWFDLELSEKPYKVLRYHTRALRSLHFHPTYPLFASASDDGSIQIFHARVYSDLMTDPLIVPLKILRGHDVKEGLGVLGVRWCPRQPWLVSSGADGVSNVWCS